MRHTSFPRFSCSRKVMLGKNYSPPYTGLAVLSSKFTHVICSMPICLEIWRGDMHPFLLHFNWKSMQLMQKPLTLLHKHTDDVAAYPPCTFFCLIFAFFIKSLHRCTKRKQEVNKTRHLLHFEYIYTGKHQHIQAHVLFPNCAINS